MAGIGYLTTASLSSNVTRVEAFRQGLREPDYVEGKNIVIDWRSGEGKVDRLAALAAELVRLKVDVIVSGGAGATRPAKEATRTIPIVMAQDTDPVGNGFVNFLRKEITDLAVKHRLPATYQSSDYVEVGGLMTYGASIDDLNRRAATYVDKILRGAKPGDLPVEQPTKFELMINLKAARQIGLIIPPT